MPSPIVLFGSCLCASVKYRVDGEPVTAVNCHCSMCRKAHGAAFRSGVIVKAATLVWLQGEDLVADYRSSPHMHRMFCRTCGSHLLGLSDQHPGIVGVALGTVDGDLPFSVTQHWNVASKASWFEITDDLPQYRLDPARGQVGRS